jgi:ribose transport system ATP-binding protein
MSEADAAQSPNLLLECRNIRQRFGGVLALDGVDFNLRRGEVHGLVGSNGAGKSTLMKILAGALPDHEGSVFLNGQPIELSSPSAALDQGIAMVYQELSGISQLSVAENMFLGRQPANRLGWVNWSLMRQQSRDYLSELGLDVNVRQRLDRYPLVIRQMVEIARGLHSGAQVLILDEPTSALSPPETRRLFELINQLRGRGVSFVFISHFIEDVLEICDRVTIFRNGKRIETSDSKSLTKQDVIHKMLGHADSLVEVGYESTVKLPPKSISTPIMKAEGLSRAGLFHDVSLDVRPGECLGLYGFVGAGHQELAHALAGSLEATSGRVLLDGEPLSPGNVHDAVGNGVVLVAADRAKTLVRGSPIYRNVTLAHLKRSVGEWLTRPRELSVAQPYVDRVGCRPANSRLLAGKLSGGNQQKIVLSKWLLGDIRVLVLEEPTRGMDVGAKDEVMKLVAEQKRQGAAIILASTEPELVLAHCDRILTFHRGRVAHEFENCEIGKLDLMRFA